MRLLITLTVGCVSLFNSALCQSNTIRIKATVIASDSGEKLAYANVLNTSTLSGTATNLEGYFELPGNTINDTIIISYIGYNDLELAINNSLPQTIELTPNQSLLDEIVITAESDYLYDLLKAAIKNVNTKTRESKTYYFLETFQFEEPIEIIEAYYNGTFSDHAMDAMEVKKGRIGIKPVNGRYFVTTESSRLFTNYNAFEKSAYFPTNPLALNKRSTKKQFKLFLKEKYKERNREICVIAFGPRDNNKASFRGTIWVDITNSQVLKFEYNLQNAEKHPFKIIGYNTLQKVDIQISKTYKDIEGEYFIHSMDFNYNVEYKDTTGNIMKAYTRAFIKPYAYDQTFTLPFFEFSWHLHQDYRNLIATEYDQPFWEGGNEFKFYDRRSEIEKFIDQNKLESNLMYPEKEGGEKKQLQFPYIPWDTTRFKMNQARPEIIEKSQRNVAFESQRYHFNIKMYLDINFINDSLTYQIYSFLDPAGTFYHFPLTKLDFAFMNILFDLMEIQKRKMEKFLMEKNPATIDEIEIVYRKHIAEFEEEAKEYKSDVDRGKNFPKLRKWNKYIYKTLGIDNIKFHGLEEYDKQKN